MLSRRVSLVVAGLVLAGLTGCAPTPAPTPTPTGFASEDEAFAAAEETYRAYVDELNAYHAGDESADPTTYLADPMLSSERELLEAMEESGVRFDGDVKIVSISHADASIIAGAASVHLYACIDDSQRRVINAAGEDVTPKDVRTRYQVDAEFASRADGLAIINHQPLDEAC
ncbi:hypothetical protein [Microbacterium lacusdiani]